jgi:xanthine dehydrogenase accessory factor
MRETNFWQITRRILTVQELLHELQSALEGGHALALATIVRRRGSVPREVGAQMLVHRDGHIFGTVGGGCGEAEVWRAALNVIDTGRPRMVQVSLTEEISLESQGVCGGIFDIFIQPWHPTVIADRPSMLALVRVIADALMKEQAVVLATLIAAGGGGRSYIGEQMLFRENGETLGAFTLPGRSPEMSTQLEHDVQDVFASGKAAIAKITGASTSTGAEIFLEPFIPPPVLLIAGAGHIAVPLAALASLMQFSVSVTDDRASFASRERFPTARQVLVGDIEAILRSYPITPRTHIVLVTRAHTHDVQGLRAILDSAASYIGMIGSQRRVWAVLKLLHDEGVAREKLLRVRAPIGLDLGGSTPEEIALSILSEIVLLRRKGSGQPLSDPLRARYQARLRHVESATDAADEDFAL